MVWDYINQFTEFTNYKHKVRSKIGTRTYSMPINLSTINDYFNKNYTPEEAQQWINSVRSLSTEEPANFEEQAIALIGKELYEAFVHGYTIKQWEKDPKLLPASVARRLPVRTNYNDTYYKDIWEGMPVDGYTPIFERMLDHENIQVFLNTDWDNVKDQLADKLVVYTGAIDRFYDYCFGELTWRTLDFEYRTEDVNDSQGCTQLNYPETTIPWVRDIEHKHFHPERKTAENKTIVSREYSRTATKQDTPYYPVNTDEDKKKFRQYQELAEQENNVIFGGRLGEYMYYDMHQVIGSALACYKNTISARLAN
jgi:UDP-galactopyranose mutase